MFGYDQFAVQIDGKILAREYGGYSLINLMIAKPDMTELAPKMFEGEVALLKKTPNKYKTYDSIEDFAKEGGDVLFLQTPTTLYTVAKDGKLEPLDNAWIKSLNDRREAA